MAPEGKRRGHGAAHHCRQMFPFILILCRGKQPPKVRTQHNTTQHCIRATSVTLLDSTPVTYLKSKTKTFRTHIYLCIHIIKSELEREEKCRVEFVITPSSWLYEKKGIIQKSELEKTVL